MFALGSGRNNDNPWKIPEGYSQQFLLLLKLFDMRIITVADSWAIVTPAKYDHVNYSKWFLISDNGGEIMVKEINSEKLAAKIPYSITSGIVNPSTLAHRTWLIIKGAPIDWKVMINDEDHTLLMKSCHMSSDS